MPGCRVDIFSSDNGLLRKLGVMEAEMCWNPAPHPDQKISVGPEHIVAAEPVVKILVEAFLPLWRLLSWGDARPSCQPNLNQVQFIQRMDMLVLQYYSTAH